MTGRFEIGQLADTTTRRCAGRGPWEWPGWVGALFRSVSALDPRGLSEQLLAQFERSRARRPPELVATLERGIETLRASHFVEAALKVGQRAPDFALPNVRGETIRLGDLLGRRAVVLAFYRGGW